MRSDDFKYSWSFLQEAKRRGIPLEEIEFKESSDISPYLEVNSDNINVEEFFFQGGKKKVEVNPWFRFTDIFSGILKPDEDDYSFLGRLFLNLVFHIVGFVDTREGRNKRELECRILISNIEKGRFGRKIAEGFLEFSPVEKYSLAMRILDRGEFQDGFMNFKSAMGDIFPNSIVYNNTYSSREVIIYIEERKSEENQRKLEILKSLFFPMGFSDRVFWEFHFGIIGNEKTMKIGEIAIF